MIITVATTEVKLDFFTYVSIVTFLTPLETAEWLELALACFLQYEAYWKLSEFKQPSSNGNREGSIQTRHLLMFFLLLLFLPCSVRSLTLKVVK